MNSGHHPRKLDLQIDHAMTDSVHILLPMDYQIDRPKLAGKGDALKIFLRLHDYALRGCRMGIEIDPFWPRASNWGFSPEEIKGWLIILSAASFLN